MKTQTASISFPDNRDIVSQAKPWLTVILSEVDKHQKRIFAPFEAVVCRTCRKYGKTASVTVTSLEECKTKASQEKHAKQEMKAIADHELRHLWQYRDPLMKQRARDYFHMMKDDRWRLVCLKDGAQVWRLPGERVHRVMGVADVDQSIHRFVEYFKDPKWMFANLFPRVDLMFVKGKVLSHNAARGKSLCQGLFKLPNLIGSGAAPGIPPRDMLWEQVYGRLPTGNALVTVQSVGPDIEGEVPPEPGSVRGAILTSGYYGRAIGQEGVLHGGWKGSGKTRVWYIAQADPRGFLPKWLVNLAATKQADNVIRLRAMFRQG